MSVSLQTWMSWIFTHLTNGQYLTLTNLNIVSVMYSFSPVFEVYTLYQNEGLSGCRLKLIVLMDIMRLRINRISSGYNVGDVI